MSKGNSESEPKVLEKIGSKYQVRWNIQRNDKKDDEDEVRESWDYDYANCNGTRYADIVEGIVRSVYSQSQVEAILSNFSQKKKVLEYLKFQAWRETAKEIASGISVSVKQMIEVKMPLSFVLSGGRYEVLADRVLKLNCPYEISIEEGVEMVTMWLAYIEPEHAHIKNDEEVEIKLVYF